MNFNTVIWMSNGFYLWFSIILSIIFLIALIGPRFDYWRLESNELYHKKGFGITSERYPTRNLRVYKKILDVFEFFLLKAGSISMIIDKKEVVHLNTILNINTKSKKIEHILNEFKIEINQLDT
ncbi:MAG: hypothetical protein ACTSR8_19745 [Promethearchaeota archaeon]